NEADDVDRQNEREKRKHEGEETHAFGAGRTLYGVSHKFIGQLRRGLYAARHQAASGGTEQKESGDDHHSGNHVGRRISEGDLGVDDFAARKEVDDLKLMGWIGGHEHYSCLSRTTPAARITFSTPAAKPSNKKTMSPQGEIPSQRSSSQPINA